MNQKTILALIAIIVTVGIVITASSIAAPASALQIIVKEKDTKSSPNSNEIRSSQEIDKKGGGLPPGAGFP